MDGAAALNVRFVKEIGFEARDKRALFAIMTSICLIGNSHLGALKLGWPSIETEFPEMNLDFYASAGDSLELVVSGNRLEPATDSIRQRLAYTSQKNGDIEATYDAYVVCGLQLSFVRAMQAYRKTLAGLRKSGKPYREITETATEKMYETLRPLLYADVLSKLRQITKAPVYLIATPLPAFERHPEIKKFGDYLTKALLPAYHTACERVAGEFEASFVAQPAETTAPLEFTTDKQFYLLPPEQVREEKAPHAHMNATFGAIVLKDALEPIRAAAKPSSP